MALHVNDTSINQIFINGFVLCAFPKTIDVSHERITQFLDSIFYSDLKSPPHRKKLFFNAQRTGHPGAPEAAVPVRVLAQVLLVVVLRVVERLSLPDVARDLAVAVLAQHLWTERPRQDLILGRDAPKRLGRGRGAVREAEAEDSGCAEGPGRPGVSHVPAGLFWAALTSLCLR